MASNITGPKNPHTLEWFVYDPAADPKGRVGRFLVLGDTTTWIYSSRSSKRMPWVGRYGWARDTQAYSALDLLSKNWRRCSPPPEIGSGWIFEVEG